MAKRDVELVVRAKDTATKAVDSVADALKRLKEVQEQVTAGSTKASTGLDGLKSSASELEARLRGLKALSTVKEQLDKATAAVGRLENEVASTAADLARLNQANAAAAASANQLRVAADATTTAIREQRAVISEVRADLTATNRELKAAETANRKLAGAVALQTAPNAELSAEYAKQQVALAALKRQQAELGGTLATQVGHLDRLKAELSQTNVELRVAEGAEKRFGAEAKRTADALERQGASVKSARADLGAIDDVAKAAAAALGGVAVEAKTIDGAAASASAELDRLTTSLNRQRAASTSGAAAGPAAAATANYRAQRVELDNLEQSYRAFQDAATAAGRALASTSAPTAELRAQFERLRVATQTAKAAYLEQAAALSTLRGTAEGSFAAFNARVGQLTAETGQAKAASQGFLSVLRQQVSEFFRAAQGADQAGAAMRRATAGTNGLRGAFAGLYGESRRSLSLLQRVRGEVISLATAYVGLFGAIAQLRGVTNAFVALQSTQNRFAVAFANDTRAVSAEIEHVRNEADRLGISFELLADTYSQFLVVSTQAGFSLQETRDIFGSISEAGRVLGLDTEQLERTFRAFQQMMNKGKITAEELTQQLGDSLSGAFRLFADALGVSTQELSRLMQRGEVFADRDTLTRVGERLREVYGAALPAAINTTAAAMGRFETAVFNARIAVAEGGFIEALTEALNELSTFFDSSEGQEFFRSLGAAAGKLISALVILAQNFDLVVKAGLAFIAIKLLPSFNALFGALGKGTKAFKETVASIRGTTVATAELTGGQAVLQAAGTRTAAVLATMRANLLSVGTGAGVARIGITALATGLGALRGLVITLTGLFRGLWAAIGGIPGLILTGITFALSGWLSSSEDVNTALSEHERILGIIQGQYADLRTQTDGWAASIQGLTLGEAQANLDALQDGVRDLRREMRDIAFDDIFIFGLENRRGLGELRQILSASNEVGGSIISLRQQLSDLRQHAGAGVQDLIDRMFAAITEAGDLEGAIAAATRVVANMEGPVTETAADVATFGTNLGEVPPAADAAAESTDTLATAIRALKEMIPAFDDELEQADGLREIADIFDAAGINAFNFLGHLEEIRALAPLVAQALDAMGFFGENTAEGFGFGAGTGLDQSAALIRQREGFIPTPKWDVDHLRVGFGSDTVTLSDGSVHEVVEGMTVTLEDANRDLFRRIEEFQRGIVRDIGASRFAQFTADQQAALTSIAYNYGSLPDRIVEAVRTGSEAEINAAILGLQGDNEGVNDGRRRQEASAFSGGNRDLFQATLDAEDDAREATEEANAATAQRLQQQQQAIENQRLINEGQQREAFIVQAINQAREENANLTEEQLEDIRQQAGELYDLQNAERLANEEREAAYKRVTDLLALQQELETSIATLKARGDPASIAQAQALELEVTQVKTQLQEAVTAALAMAEALGDEQMIANLRNVTLELRDTADAATYLGLSVDQIGQLGQSFVSGLTGFIDGVAKSIADATNKTITWKEAIGQVWDSFRQFAANFLLEIAKMIIKQAILNALQGAFGGSGGIMGAFVSQLHSGGIAGRNGKRRFMPAGIYANAARFHGGGMPGLKRGEVAAVLRKNEEVLSEDSPRNILNGGAAAGGGSSKGASPDRWKIVNALDASEVMTAALGSESGERVLINWIRMNARGVQSALQSGG